MPLRALYRPESFIKQILQHLLPYVTAIVFPVIALLLTIAIPSDGNKPFFAIFFAAIITCAWLSGILSSLLSAGISAMVLFYFIIAPARSLHGKDPGDIVRLLIFLAIALLLSLAMTKFRRVQQELAFAQERFHLAHEIAKIWAWELDPVSGKFLWSSRSTTPGSMQLEDTQALFEQIHPEDRDRVTQKIRQAVKLQQPYETEFRISPRSGESYWLASRGESFRTPRGEQRVVGVNVDITSRKKAEETLEIAAKSELAGKLAHEINNPLQSLIHALYLIRHLTVQTEAFQYAELAHSEAERVARLLSEILELYSKPNL